MWKTYVFYKDIYFKPIFTGVSLLKFWLQAFLNQMVCSILDLDA